MFYLVEDVVEEVLAEVGGDVGAGVAVEDGEEADLVAVVQLPELGHVAVLHAVRRPALRQVEPVRHLPSPRRRLALAFPRPAHRLVRSRMAMVAAALLLAGRTITIREKNPSPHKLFFLHEIVRTPDHPAGQDRKTTLDLTLRCCREAMS